MSSSKKKFTCFNKQVKPFDPYLLSEKQIVIDKQIEEAEEKYQNWREDNKDDEDLLNSTDFTNFMPKSNQQLATNHWIT